MSVELRKSTSAQQFSAYQKAPVASDAKGKLFVKKRTGRTENVSYDKITTRILRLCYGLNMEFIDPAQISWKVIQGIYPGVTTCELDNLAAHTCAMMSTVHPDYGRLAARIFTNNLHKETEKVFSTVVEHLFHHVSPDDGEPMPLVGKKFYEDVMANKDELNSAILYDRDYSYSFFGLKTLERAYLLRIHDKVVERPQHLLMRVAVALHGRNLEKVIETYTDLSLRYFIHATPTLFNAGTTRAGLSSCFLLTATSEDDSIENIYKLFTDCAIISKYSGGIGVSIHDIRAKGSLIRSTNGRSEGIIPLLGVLDRSARFVTQSNKRPGSVAVYLEPWHAEIREFLRLKENAGAEEFRARSLFYGLWIPDLFMKKAKSEDVAYQQWCLFDPAKARGLADVYGDDFEALYDKYEREGRFREKISARDLLYDIIESQIKTGGPYLLYKDSVNRKNNQKHMGTIRGSNLCVAPETRILTKTGYHRIEKLQDKEVEVWNGTQFSKTIVRRTSERSELLTVKFSNGSTLQCTEYHKFYIQPGYNKTQVVVKEAKDLLPDDKLVKAEFPVIEAGTDLSPFKYPYTAGFFTGDGTYSKAETNQRQCSFKKALDTNYCKKHQAFQHHLTLPTDLEKCHALVYKPVPIICLYGEQKKMLLEHLEHHTNFTDGSGRIVCFLPYDIPSKYQVPIHHNLEIRLRYFEGLCDADGTAQVADIFPTTSIQICSAQEGFLEEIKLMLQTMGVDAKVCKGQNARISAMPDGKGGHKNVSCKSTERLLLTSLQVKSLQKIGFAPKRLRLADEVSRKEAKRYVKVVAVERTGRQDATYCFNEPVEHKGIFNGVITGNCTEITTYTSSDEVSVCNINSIGLPSYIKNQKDGTPVFDFQLLHAKAKVATKNLDRVIEETHYPVPRARYSNMRHRPIGVGVSGLADTFSLMRVPFDSIEARNINKTIFETIYHAAVEASCELAQELGPYDSYEGSEFSKGKFQFDLWAEASGEPVVHSGLWDWEELREKVLQHGMRNSLLTAPMPTASTSQIIDFNECFEAYNSNIYKRETLSGEFQIVNRHLLKDLCDLGVWNEDIKDKIIKRRGSVQGISEIPADVQALYKTVWETSQRVIIDMAADRGLYIDQSQSMNIFMAEPTFPKLSALHMYAWGKGLKTGMYYLRSKPASAPLQFSISNKDAKTKAKDDDQHIEPSQIKLHITSKEKEQAEAEEAIPVCKMEEGCMSCSG